MLTVDTMDQETGWLPQHIVAVDQDGTVLGVVPLYVKRYALSYRVITFLDLVFCWTDCFKIQSLLISFKM
jgi:predicted N-acyltransferase